MLSRTAANLYWMGRYFERAESTARLLNACFQPGLPYVNNINQLYALPLQIQNTYDNFINQNLTLNLDNVCKFLIASNSPASIRTSLELTRENARHERSRLSNDVWEAVNQTWIEFQERKNQPLQDCTEWLHQRACLFQGTISVTMPETVSRYFIRLGTYLERAVQTISVLEVKGALDTKDDETDYYHLCMILRAARSFEAYQETVIELPTNDRVLEFLLFYNTIPRSVHYAIEKAMRLLEEIGSEKQLASLKASLKLLTKLRHNNLNHVFAVGQDIYLKTLKEEVENLAVTIQEGYFC